jgi:outer membrane biosynthesis protein TonB
VADTTRPPSEEPNLRVSLLRNLAGAVGLVVLVAAVFGVIGMIGRADTPTPVAVEAPDDDETADTEEVDEEPTADDGTDDADDADEAAVEDEPEPTPSPDEAEEPAADEPEDDASDEPAEEADEEADEEPAPEDEAEEPDAPAIPPGDISVQVLDGYKTDGGTAARGVATSLRDGGYRVVAENQALSYERTTVLWTAGNEAAARQVAAEIGAAEVREQPGNLSSAVDVHVVVGADRG